VDALNCSTLPSFKPEYLKKGFDNEMVIEAREKLRINKVFILTYNNLFFIYLSFSFINILPDRNKLA